MTRGARRWIVALLLAPFVAVIVVPRSIVPGVGDALGRGLAALGRLAVAPRAHPRVLHAPPDAVAGIPEAPEAHASPRDGGPARSGASGGAGAGAARRRGISIDAATTERLLAGAVGSAGGRTARDAEGRAIGVRLRGVSALNVGLRDGDIVTSIDGFPTMTDDDATPIALEALGRGKPVRGTILRDGRVIDVYVELPAGADPTAPR